MIHSSRTLSVLVDDAYFENHFPHRSVSDTKKHTLLFAYDQNYLWQINSNLRIQTYYGRVTILSLFPEFGGHEFL